jgi:hypothetical protein
MSSILLLPHTSLQPNNTQDLSLTLNKIENEKWSTVDTAFESLRQRAGDGEYLFDIPKVKENKLVFFHHDLLYLVIRADILITGSILLLSTSQRLMVLVMLREARLKTL